MSPPSTEYTQYENSFFGGHTKPPPPPPKPGAQETSFTNASLESQSNTPTSDQELSLNQTRVTHAHSQPAEYGRHQGIVHPPQNQDPGERWLPKMLEDKSKQQLTEILENQKLLNALANSTLTVHPSTSTYQSFLEAALKENIALALHLKEVEARLIQLRSTNQTKLLATHALERQWRQKQSDMDQALAPFAPPSLYQNLSQAIQEEEQISSSLETSFLESDGVAAEREVTDWVKKFRESRKVYYSRLAKKDRWDEGRIGGWR
ncbi:putative endosomal sorting complex assembly [Erysiphe neolycopersici]|uniref:Putative endosomal sorting complex assembly n=1 Tax=Erysiphe neolycopersici TaxID=212602 RepID=A0A420HJI7_9PEZI|nr:putative endosomal sorting complex assembly [Erysiphe neolycopersici]